MLRISTLKVVSDSKLYLEVFYTIFLNLGELTIYYNLQYNMI